MMEPGNSSLSRERDSPEKEPATERSGDQHFPERVLGSDLMEMGGDLGGVKLNLSEIVDEIYEGVSSIVEYSLQWKQSNEELKRRAFEVEVKERSVMERVVELEKKEERLREVEEREKKIGLYEKSVTLRLEKQEEDNDMKQYMELCFMRLVLEEKEEEVMVGLKEREKEVECLSELIDKKSCELDKRMEEFDLKEKVSIERSRKEAELVGVSLRQLEEKEKKLRLVEEDIKEKRTELEKKVEVVEAKQKELVLLEAAIKEKRTEVEKKMEVTEAKQKKLSLLEAAIKEKMAEVEKKVEATEAKQEELRLLEAGIKEKMTEVEKEVDVVEAKQKELILLDETIKEKRSDVERKEQIFEAKEKAQTEEMEQKSKFLELREKKLEEMVLEFELKRREFENPSVRAETSKRSRVKVLVEKGSEVDSLIRPAKRLRTLREHSHDYEEKETEYSDEEPLQMLQAHEEEIEEVFVIDEDSDEEDPEPLLCADSEFNDFNKSMSSFVVGQVWSLYDPIDTMPRLYARIKQITKSRSSFQVTWMEPKDGETVPVACGRYIYGNTETIKSLLTFSHLMHPIRHGKNFVAVNPKKGETWALFRDWSKSWDTNPEQHKPPYVYDFVEVLLNSDEDGIGVTYLGKVEGFVSLFTQSVQCGVFSFVIKPDEIHRFSHRVPSFRMTGEEKEGVPPGSFELDPAAIPNSVIKVDHSTYEETKGAEGQSEECGIAREVNEHDGSSKDIPIIID